MDKLIQLVEDSLGEYKVSGTNLIVEPPILVSGPNLLRMEVDELPEKYLGRKVIDGNFNSYVVSEESIDIGKEVGIFYNLTSIPKDKYDEAIRLFDKFFFDAMDGGKK